MLLKKRLLKLVLPFTTFAILNTSLLFALPSETNVFPATDSHIHYIGRAYKTGENAISLCWPGSTIKTNFQGTSIGVYLQSAPGDYPDANYINVFIDGEQLTPIRCDKQTNYFLLKDGLKDTVHTLEIYKRSDGNAGPITLTGISLDSTKSLEEPIQDTNLKIEFYGDSILSGTANEAPTYPEYTQAELDKKNLTRDPCSEFSSANSYLSFPAITARNLNAECINISQGGLGLTTSPIPPLSMSLLWNQAGGPPNWKANEFNAPSIWDFSQSKVPDYVVVSLGGNDYKYGPIGDFKTEYIKFINSLRKEYPAATIFCITTPPTFDFSPKLKQVTKDAVDTLNANGDQNVFFHALTEYTPYKDYEHPRVDCHKELAAELTKVIKQHMTSNMEVTYDITEQYDSGAKVTFTLTNHNNFPITDWNVNFTLPNNTPIANLWNGSYTRDGNNFTIKGLAWNKKIAANSSTTFGAILSLDSSNTLSIDSLNCSL